MNKNTIGLLVTLVAMCGLSASALSQPERPRLVVGIVVDQMRWDYLYTRCALWAGEGGFARLLGEGYSFDNTTVDYVPTITACGHASIFTGTTPAFHGIAGNNYYLDGKKVSSVDDPVASGVGTTSRTGRKSPRNLLVTTIGDQLKLATSFGAKVVGVALKDRAAVLPAGHGADLALWYDKAVPGFITSDYYVTELPQWVGEFNRQHSDDLGRDVWNAPCGITLTADLAMAAIDACSLGRDEVTDLLTVSFSTTDAAAHAVGTDALLLDTLYRQLDADLGRLLRRLDDRVGRGKYLVFLTADHGGTHSYPYMTAHRLPSGAWSPGEARKAVNERLRERFGVDGLLSDDLMYSFYVNHAAIDSASLDRDAVVAAATCELEALPMVQWAVDVERCYAAPVPDVLRERILRGYCPARSGEIFVVLTTGRYSGNPADPGSTHGSWNRSDSHIPFMLLGWGVPHGSTSQPTKMTDIAATVAAMLHIEAPDAGVGAPAPLLITK